MANKYKRPQEAEEHPERFYLSCSTGREDKREDDYPKILEAFKYLTHQRNKLDWKNRKDLSACLWDMSTSPPLLLECNFEKHISITPQLIQDE